MNWNSYNAGSDDYSDTSGGGLMVEVVRVSLISFPCIEGNESILSKYQYLRWKWKIGYAFSINGI